MANPLLFVDPPARPARRGGIKSVATFVDGVNRLGAASSLQWLSDGCSFPQVAPGLCWSDTPTGDKDFEGIDTGTSLLDNFAGYSGVRCFAGPDSDYDARARKLLEDGEDRLIEEHLLNELATAATPAVGTVTGAAQVIATIDEYLDQEYIGLGVIIMSRFNAVQLYAADALVADGLGGLTTPNGTPVLATGAAPNDFIYATGAITVYRSEVIVNRVIDPTVNEEMAIAERIYGIAIDCNFAIKWSFVLPATQQQQEPIPDDELVLTIGTIPGSPVPNGTDISVNVHSNGVPEQEVILHYRINGGSWQSAGEMTQVNPIEFIDNLATDGYGAGDSVELYAKSGTVSSPTITVDIT